ncbi:MAG TPA: rRNA maturation RNase YbeY [Methylophilaceae bacterium]|nr:rRNA maturation RNase YbeY [Methylophilaceae bacterium]
MNKLAMAVQYASAAQDLPTAAQFRKWARLALRADAEIALRVVDEDEGRMLNRDYRGKDYATNVLTFPLAEKPLLMGDIVLCAPVVAREAEAQQKPLLAHYAHLTVHGVLHLQGYDHETEAEAVQMESMETEIITKMGYADPYLSEKAADAERSHIHE